MDTTAAVLRMKRVELETGEADLQTTMVYPDPWVDCPVLRSLGRLKWEHSLAVLLRAGRSSPLQELVECASCTCPARNLSEE